MLNIKLISEEFMVKSAIDDNDILNLASVSEVTPGNLMLSSTSKVSPVSLRTVIPNLASNSELYSSSFAIFVAPFFLFSKVLTATFGALV